MSPRFSQPVGAAVTTFTALAPGAMCTQVQPENSRVAAITDDNGNRRMDNSGGGNENARDCGLVRVNRAKRLKITPFHHAKGGGTTFTSTSSRPPACRRHRPR